MDKLEIELTGDAVCRSKADWKSHLNNWGIYAAAAGASLSAATGADASIIHATLNLNVTINSKGNVQTVQDKAFHLVSNGLGAGSFFVENNPARVSHPLTQYGGPGNTSVDLPRVGFAGLAFTGTDPKIKFFAVKTPDYAAKKFVSGELIGGAFLNGKVDLKSVSSEGFANGEFAASSEAFVGFETVHGDLGWLEVQLLDRNHDGFPDELKLIQYAYNNTPGGAIDAGSLIIPTVPEPGTAALGLLAAGALGLLALRRRKAEVAEN